MPCGCWILRAWALALAALAAAAAQLDAPATEAAAPGARTLLQERWHGQADALHSVPSAVAANKHAVRVPRRALQHDQGYDQGQQQDAKASYEAITAAASPPATPPPPPAPPAPSGQVWRNGGPFSGNRTGKGWGALCPSGACSSDVCASRFARAPTYQSSQPDMAVRVCLPHRSPRSLHRHSMRGRNGHRHGCTVVSAWAEGGGGGVGARTQAPRRAARCRASAAPVHLTGLTPCTPPMASRNNFGHCTRGRQPPTTADEQRAAAELPGKSARGPLRVPAALAPSHTAPFRAAPATTSATLRCFP